MNRTQFNKVVVPGLFSFMVDSYKPRATEEEWRGLVEACGAVKNSKRAYEEAAYYAGFGMVAGKGEGEAITYDEMVQGPKLFGLLKSNFETIKRAISGKILAIIDIMRAIPRKDYCVA